MCIFVNGKKSRQVKLAASLALLLLLLVPLGACGSGVEKTTQRDASADNDAVKVSDQEETQADRTPQQSSRERTDRRLAETLFDYEVKKGETIVLDYSPLDPAADADIIAACVRACAKRDPGFIRDPLPAEGGIWDRDSYTDAQIGCDRSDPESGVYFVGDTGKAIVFMKFLPVPEPEFMGMHPDYYFVLRTADNGRTWEKSDNALCFYLQKNASLAFDDNFYLFGYSEVNGGNWLYSNDGMDSCMTNTWWYYVIGAEQEEGGSKIALTYIVTDSGFLHDGSARYYRGIYGLQMQQISAQEIPATTAP